MQCCHNYRKYNSSSKKNNNNNCHLPAIWKAYQVRGQLLEFSLLWVLYLLKKVIKLVTSNALNAALLMLFRKLCKKIASTFHTWLPFNYCQTISCVLFISSNATDWMQCNPSYFWSSYHIWYNTILFSPSLFLFLRKDQKHNRYIQKRAFWTSHLQTLLLPQWLTSDFTSLPL